MARHERLLYSTEKNLLEQYPQFLRILWIPEGVELNYGYHEDSDSVRTIQETCLGILEERKYGALKVQVIENPLTESYIIPDIFYYHQPEYPSFHLN